MIYYLYRYIKGTVTYGIELGGSDVDVTDMMMQTFADVSLVDRLPTRYFTAGYVVFVAGGPVYWKTKKQTFVALSTTEAEYTNLIPAGLSV